MMFYVDDGLISSTNLEHLQTNLFVQVGLQMNQQKSADWTPNYTQSPNQLLFQEI
jgi:hypothetical protein